MEFAAGKLSAAWALMSGSELLSVGSFWLIAISVCWDRYHEPSTLASSSQLTDPGILRRPSAFTGLAQTGSDLGPQRDLYITKSSISVDDMKEIFGMKLRVVAIVRQPSQDEFDSGASTLMAHIKVTGSRMSEIILLNLTPGPGVRKSMSDEFIMPEIRSWNPSPRMVYFANFENDTDLSFFGICVTEIHEGTKTVDFRVCQLSHYRYLKESQAADREARNNSN